MWGVYYQGTKRLQINKLNTESGYTDHSKVQVLAHKLLSKKYHDKICQEHTF